jgi:hypothetical protein
VPSSLACSSRSGDADWKNPAISTGKTITGVVDHPDVGDSLIVVSNADAAGKTSTGRSNDAVLNQGAATS